MLKIALGLGAIYAIAYVCSLAQTPEERAANEESVNEFGKVLFAIVMIFFGLLWLSSVIAPRGSTAETTYQSKP